MMDNRLNIAIVEDNHQIRKNLVEMILNEKTFRLLGEFSNAEEAFDTIPHLMLDIVIMDIELPGMSGIDCVAKLKPLCPKTQFMMFTVFEESEQVFNALSAGASGYMLKTSSEEEIIEGVKELQAGGSPMSPLIARKVVASFQKQKQEMKEVESLSAREVEILQLLAEGMLYKEIGDKLSVTLGTVKQHLHRVYEKLHVNNKTEAINKVFR